MAAKVTTPPFNPSASYSALQTEIRSWKKANKEIDIKNRAELENRMNATSDKIKALIPVVPKPEAGKLRQIDNQIKQCVELDIKVYDLAEIFDEAISRMLRDITDLAPAAIEAEEKGKEEDTLLSEFEGMLNEDLMGFIETENFVTRIHRFPHSVQRDQLYYRAACAYDEYGAAESILEFVNLVQDPGIRQNIESILLNRKVRRYTDEIAKKVFKIETALRYLRDIQDIDKEVELIRKTPPDVQVALRSACFRGEEVNPTFVFVLFSLAKVMPTSGEKDTLMLKMGRLAIKIHSPLAIHILPELSSEAREIFKKELESDPKEGGTSSGPLTGGMQFPTHLAKHPRVMQIETLLGDGKYAEAENEAERIPSGELRRFVFVIIAGFYLTLKMASPMAKIITSKQLPLEIQQNMLNAHTKMLIAEGEAEMAKKAYMRVVEIARLLLIGRNREALLLQIPIEEREKILAGCFNVEGRLIKEKLGDALILIRVMPSIDEPSSLKKDYLLSMVVDACLLEKQVKLAMKAANAMVNPIKREEAMAKVRTVMPSKPETTSAVSAASSSSASSSSSSTMGSSTSA